MVVVFCRCSSTGRPQGIAPTMLRSQLASQIVHRLSYVDCSTFPHDQGTCFSIVPRRHFFLLIFSYTPQPCAGSRRRVCNRLLPPGPCCVRLKAVHMRPTDRLTLRACAIAPTCLARLQNAHPLLCTSPGHMLYAPR